MGKFFSTLLSSLDCCEKEVERIFHINARIKIRNKQNGCNLHHSHKHKDENIYCDCDCECDCVKK